MSTRIVGPTRTIILVPIDPEVNNLTIDFSFDRYHMFNQISVQLFEISDMEIDIESFSFH